MNDEIGISRKQLKGALNRRSHGAMQTAQHALEPTAPLTSRRAAAQRFPLGGQIHDNGRQTKMTINRIMGFVATCAGWLLLVLAAVEVVLVFYYRPTLEYTYVEGRPISVPYWLTGESVGFAFGAFLTVIGGSLLWAGRRWRRRCT